VPRWISVLTLACLVGLTPLPGADIPRPAPSYTVKLVSGQQIPLSSYRGEVVALLFVSTTCPHCQDTCRLMSSLRKEYGSRGFETVAVAFNAMAKMFVPEFIQKSGATFPVGYDEWESVAAFLQRPTILQTFVPIMVFIDRQGVIRGQHLGDDQFFGNQEKNIRSTIETLLKTPASSKAGGSKAPGAAKKGAS
jgi:peroxiredoxin